MSLYFAFSILIANSIEIAYGCQSVASFIDFVSNPIIQPEVPEGIYEVQNCNITKLKTYKS